MQVVAKVVGFRFGAALTVELKYGVRKHCSPRCIAVLIHPEGTLSGY